MFIAFFTMIPFWKMRLEGKPNGNILEKNFSKKPHRKMIVFTLAGCSHVSCLMEQLSFHNEGAIMAMFRAAGITVKTSVSLITFLSC